MKKYRVGFTAGTYDMFHVGHLNLIEHAKLLCDYLIVGVNQDELVQSYKHKCPLICEEQRLRIVSALKPVDEAHLMSSLNKMEAWEKFKFDAVFIGSDYEGSERYRLEAERLKEVEAEVCFVPYSEGISSTILANRIIDNEMNANYFQDKIARRMSD
ncbi:adenylyltransferase/cytidyltransferase family protein [Enterococcus pseudoavium]|uniref:Adenylyltransferase/cytidyltransferase family protein n=1 Tax=Enterococcus pseudoavium TaxID=44007 RepID=A0ABU3FL73_9ENTE|nr:adenylyltransferase/cytidyltransferase family protein [Enterococcus pseudoavium]MDT2771480.1 adenylyltransferase/cytidyltransferase family protein [Enterococcus pseudoavium]